MDVPVLMTRERTDRRRMPGGGGAGALSSSNAADALVTGGVAGSTGGSGSAGLLLAGMLNEDMDPRETEEDEEPLEIPHRIADLDKLFAAGEEPKVLVDGKETTFRKTVVESLQAFPPDFFATRVDVQHVFYRVPLPSSGAFGGGLLSKLVSSVTGKKKPAAVRTILDDVTFTLFPYETTALLGGPQSGKTSLFDVIARRRREGVTGEIIVNGRAHNRAYHRLVSYVMQGDEHAGQLSVKETLQFAARCQMPVDDPTVINSRVDVMLQLLGLKNCENTPVGDWTMRGVSGGEKRRTSIGIEWVKGPAFFLLDEPTTGLDSGAALNVGRILRIISQRGTPVLCAMLQPSWELVGMFDKLIILSQGQVAYWGPVKKALPYFASLGYHCPANYSASEFLSEVVDHPEKFPADAEAGPRSVRTRQDFIDAWRRSQLSKRMLAKASTQQLPKQLPNALSRANLRLPAHGDSAAVAPPGSTSPSLTRTATSASPLSRTATATSPMAAGAAAAASSLTPTTSDGTANGNGVDGAAGKGGENNVMQTSFLLSDEFADDVNYPRSVWEQFRLLMWRGYIIHARHRRPFLMSTVGLIIVGILMALLFFNMGTTLTESRAKMGLLFFLAARAAFDALAGIPAVFMQRPYVERQRDAKWYSVLPYVSSSLLLELPIVLFHMTIFTVIVYWAVGFVRDAAHFFIQLLVLCLLNMTFVSFARMCAALTPSPLMASLLASTVGVLLLLFSGFLITATRMPRPWIWMTYLTPLKFGIDALTMNEFIGRHIHCATHELVPPTSVANFTQPWPNGFASTQTCTTTSGEQLLSSSGIYTTHAAMWGEIAAVVPFFLLFTTAFYLAVRFLRWPPPPRRSPPARAGAGDISAASAAAATGGALSSSAGSDSGEVDKGKMHELETLPAVSSSSAAGTVMNGHGSADSMAVTAPATARAATLSWESLRYTVKTPMGDRVLLADIDGYVRPGMLLALMGASGAGKTTLQDVLAQRKNLGRTAGHLFVDGRPLDRTYPRLIGYVEQFDTHFPSQTVIEAVRFAARARLPADMSKAQREAVIARVMHLLDLDSIAGELVGFNSAVGIGPDERKRLSIAVELVAQPPILFLDEPTSGLDSNGADNVMGAIEQVAKAGTAVICTIHQPSTRIFMRATHLLMLKRGGQTVYFGELGPDCRTLMSYWERFGLRCPSGMNPADFVLEVSLGKVQQFLDRSPGDGNVPAVPKPLEDLAATWRQSSENERLNQELKELHDRPPERGPMEPAWEKSLRYEYAASMWTQFVLCVRRWVMAIYRSTFDIFIVLFRAVLLGFVIGTVFWQRPHDQHGANERVAVLFFSAVFAFLTAFAYMPAIFMQRAVFYRERAERLYRVIPYGVSRALLDAPVLIIGAAVYCMLVYWMAGLRAEASHFFFFLMVVVIFGNVPLVFAQALASVFAAPDVAGLAFSSTFASFALSAGFLIPRTQIRVWMRWLYWASFNRYFLEAVAVNELKGDHFHCSATDYVDVHVPLHNGSTAVKQYCPITSGDQMLENIGAYTDLMWYDLLALVGFWSLLLVIFVVGLRVFRHIKR